MKKYDYRSDSITRVFEGVPLVWGNGKSLCKVGQALSGAYGDGFHSDSDSYSISGYNTLEHFLQEHKNEICEGAYVIDMRHLTFSQVCDTLTGPILKCDQDPGINFDYYISLDLYVQKHRKAGAKIGRYLNGQVVWEK